MKRNRYALYYMHFTALVCITVVFYCAVSARARAEVEWGASREKEGKGKGRTGMKKKSNDVKN